MSDKQSLDTSRRVVVKIGSALLVDQDQGAVYHAWLEALAEDSVRKTQALGQLSQIAAGHTIFASSTAECDIETLAGASGRPPMPTGSSKSHRRGAPGPRR